SRAMAIRQESHDFSHAATFPGFLYACTKRRERNSTNRIASHGSTESRVALASRANTITSVRKEGSSLSRENLRATIAIRTKADASKSPLVVSAVPATAGKAAIAIAKPAETCALMPNDLASEYTAAEKNRRQHTPKPIANDVSPHSCNGEISSSYNFG